MTETRRKRSEADIYHVFVRGVNRQIIFEDDEDRAVFLKKLDSAREKEGSRILAWCLMGNHVHLLVKADIHRLSSLMRRLEAAYARWFNGRHDRVGTLFQGRFGSEPVESDAQLMAVVRYIHRNPEEAGLCSYSEYRWSSYGNYIASGRFDADGFIRDLFGTREDFVRFHDIPNAEEFMEDLTFRGKSTRRRMTDCEARDLGNSLLGDGWRQRVAVMPKADRNRAIAVLKGEGITIRQIERLTGIGRGIISRI